MGTVVPLLHERCFCPMASLPRRPLLRGGGGGHSSRASWAQPVLVGANADGLHLPRPPPPTFLSAPARPLHRNGPDGNDRGGRWGVPVCSVPVAGIPAQNTPRARNPRAVRTFWGVVSGGGGGRAGDVGQEGGLSWSGLSLRGGGGGVRNANRNERGRAQRTGHGAFSTSKVGGWRFAGGGWWRLAIGGRWFVAVGGSWRLVAVGGWWRLAVGGGWRLAVGGGWRLVVPGGCPEGLSSAKKNIWFLKAGCECTPQALALEGHQTDTQEIRGQGHPVPWPWAS